MPDRSLIPLYIINKVLILIDAEICQVSFQEKRLGKVQVILGLGAPRTHNFIKFGPI